VAGDLERIKALGGCVTLLGGEEAGAEEPVGAGGRSDAA
jgi:hypothetical protein